MESLGRALTILGGAVAGLIVGPVVGFIIGLPFLWFGTDDNPYTETGDAGSFLIVIGLGAVVGPIAAWLTREDTE